MSCRILIADDDPDMLRLVATLLGRMGATVTATNTGAELLDRLIQEPFDLVVTDDSMPWLTGMQVIHSIREAGITVPVVLMTARDDSELEQQLRALGDGSFLLRKPFSPMQLSTCISPLLPDLLPPLAATG